MSGIELASHSPEETQKFGARIGEMAEAGDTFLLLLLGLGHYRFV
ncbi:hypothetical protein ACFLU4_09425 [Chloroflexota bacterium]